MSDTTNEHVTAIRNIASMFHDDFPWPADDLVRHADELEKQLAEANEAFDRCEASVLPYQEYIEELEARLAEAEARALNGGDGMSDAMNSHATAIKQAARDLAQGNIWATDRHIETIDHHAGALATELDEANARIARLIPLARHHRAIYGNAMSPEEAEWARAVIAHGDLDDAPGDTEGG